MVKIQHEFSGFKAHQHAREVAKSMKERGFKNIQHHKEGRTRVVSGELSEGMKAAERGR